MKNYYRIMLGRRSSSAAECFAEGWIGTGFGITQDLSRMLTDDWRAFNRQLVPIWLASNPGKSRISAGLACGFTWTVAKGIQKGDLVLSPDGSGRYRVGEVTGDYKYVAGVPLAHRRAVRWMDVFIDRSDMSDVLRNSAGSIGTVSDISRHRDEIERLIGGSAAGATVVSSDPAVEDPAAFALEQHLEEFLVQNWSQTELGKEYNIYEEDGEVVGQQFATDTGPIDILAISKDKKRLLVVELKKGRASDVVVGQILRYMGYVKEELLEPGQSVQGMIIALEDDPRIRRALAMASNVAFYRYQVTFKLVKLQS